MLIIPIFNIGSDKIGDISKIFYKINNKFLIEYCLESIVNVEQILFIVSYSDCVNMNIDKLLLSLFKTSIVKIIEHSDSVLDTLSQSIELINNNEKITIFAPPFTYFLNKFDINKDVENIHVVLFKTNNPIHCYVNIENNTIIQLKEKSIIGNYALIGLYHFKNKEILFRYFNKENKFISDLLNCSIKDKVIINYSIADLVYPFKDEKYSTYIKKYVIKDRLKIGISCDHSGFISKKELMSYLDVQLIPYIDYGCYTEHDCDYQDFINQQYKGFINNEFNIGISICRSGQGVNIAANHTGFFSALVYDKWSAQMAIEHNNCNFFCLSERLLENKIYTIKDILDIVHNYNFLGGRFIDRLLKI